jgi:ATP-binding cassette subfamily F protein uup
VVGYMKDFLFTPEQASMPIGALSGGERGRLMLARALARPSILLVLDEPTNDLDLETLDLLQELLADYDGTVLLVSHDRDFLDRVVTSTLAAEGDGRWIEYAGGYSDMLAQRGDRRDAEKPRERKTVAARAPQVRKGLTFKDKHALATLPARIEALNAELAGLRERLADQSFYARDPQGFDAAAKRLSAAETDLTAAEDMWLELEVRREAAEGS